MEFFPIFLKPSDLKKAKETERHFEKISGDLDNALAKNAQTIRTKPQECEEAHNVLTATRTAFGHTALDYVFQVSQSPMPNPSYLYGPILCFAP